MSLALLLSLWGCGQDALDPGLECAEDGSFGCCADADCADGEICHFSYTCYTQRGERRCSEPAGDRQCHQACNTEGSLEECDNIGEACQQVEHVQGGDRIEQALICF